LEYTATEAVICMIFVDHEVVGALIAALAGRLLEPPCEAFGMNRKGRTAVIRSPLRHFLTFLILPLRPG